MTTPTTDIHTIQNTTINTAPGITLTDLQRKHVGVVLDLFQAKATNAKLNEWLVDDAVYEDLFATCKNREEVAGQMLGLPLVTQSSRTISHTVTSLTPNTTCTDGKGIFQKVDEIQVKFNHIFQFKLGGKEVEMDSTLIIYSQNQDDGGSGKIIRFQDRPMGEIPGNSLLSMMRKANAVVAPNLVGIPKDDKQDTEKMLAHQR